MSFLLCSAGYLHVTSYLSFLSLAIPTVESFSKTTLMLLISWGFSPSQTVLLPRRAFARSPFTGQKWLLEYHLPLLCFTAAFLKSDPIHLPMAVRISVMGHPWWFFPWLHNSGELNGSFISGGLGTVHVSLELEWDPWLAWFSPKLDSDCGHQNWLLFNTSSLCLLFGDKK